jgi:signal transduction histidine kinase
VTEATKATVLVVEDNPGDADLIQYQLEQASRTPWNVECVGRLSEALAFLKEREANVALLDLSLPDSHGLDTLIQVKACAEHLPIVVLTGRSDEDLGLQALKHGAQDYLVKGSFRVDGPTLGRVMEYAIERKGTERALRGAEKTAQSAEKTARNAQEEAERANQAKSEFLSGMSHELRTPLNAILGFAQLLEMDDLSTDQKESAHQILRAGRHLLDLINEILDIGRIESGHLSLSLEGVDSRSLLEDCIGLLRPLADDRNITLEMDQPPHSGLVLADQQRLKQVLLNLMSNAVKYNHEGGSVRISVTEGGESTLRLAVVDSGPGIAFEHMDLLFLPFERLPSSRGVQGTGLGLTLSKQLVEAMGGTIGVQSEPGAGSTFWVELPIAKEPTEAVEPPEAPRRSVESALTPHVLYIEDNLANFSLVHRLLTPLEIDLMPAMQGQLGLDLAREHRPDLVLLDMHLPDIPGQEVLQQLRSDPATSHIPVVIVSADVTSGPRESLKELGVDAYLTKPIDVKEFLRVVTDILNGDRSNAERAAVDAGVVG